jgi:hypothetical protein
MRRPPGAAKSLGTYRELITDRAHCQLLVGVSAFGLTRRREAELWMVVSALIAVSTLIT